DKSCADEHCAISGSCESGKCDTPSKSDGAALYDALSQMKKDLAAMKAAERRTIRDKNVGQVQYNEGEPTHSVLKSKVRLAAGESSVSGPSKSSLALNDPFGDSPASVRAQSKRVAMAPQEEFELPTPDPVQSSTSQMRIEPAQQDPVELTPPEPLRKGL